MSQGKQENPDGDVGPGMSDVDARDHPVWLCKTRGAAPAKQDT